MPGATQKRYVDSVGGRSSPDLIDSLGPVSLSSSSPPQQAPQPLTGCLFRMRGWISIHSHVNYTWTIRWIFVTWKCLLSTASRIPSHNNRRSHHPLQGCLIQLATSQGWCKQASASNAKQPEKINSFHRWSFPIGFLSADFLREPFPGDSQV